jgi:hypothetical protein
MRYSFSLENEAFNQFKIRRHIWHRSINQASSLSDLTPWDGVWWNWSLLDARFGMPSG